jgi:hypothetical protein
LAGSVSAVITVLKWYGLHTTLIKISANSPKSGGNACGGNGVFSVRPCAYPKQIKVLKHCIY